MRAASLNHVYRLIWDKIRLVWIAVAETSRGNGKSGRAAKAGCIVLAATVSVAHASPNNASVVAGVADIKTNAGNTTITQTTGRAIINWNNFSVDNGHLLQFVQPNANSAILNRVLGNNPSQILGEIRANGQVFVINPHGVLVGPNGVIQAASFVASTLNLSNNAFMAGGSLNLSGNSDASIENLGFIRATSGDVVLIGRSVSNSGTINAAQGSATLAAGNNVLLQTQGDQRVVVQAGIAGGGTGVNNDGTIRAAQAQLSAAGGNVYALAINAGGSIDATGVVNQNGRILLTSDGGDIAVTGSLKANNADGSGGTILVGGDTHGQNPQIADAGNVKVSPNAQLHADAESVDGNGGKVVVWSNGTTDFKGQISARGGSESGDGGSAEVSGKTALNYSGLTDLRATNGKTGTVLLDPNDIVIDTNTGATSNTSGSTSTISASDLNAQLAVANLTIQTDNTATGGSGNITFSGSNDFQSSLPHALTLIAGNDIIANTNLNFTFGATGTIGLASGTQSSNAYTAGALKFTAGRDILINQAFLLQATAVGGNSNATVPMTSNLHGGDAAVSFAGLDFQAGRDLNTGSNFSIQGAAQGGNGTSSNAFTASSGVGGVGSVTLGQINLSATRNLIVGSMISTLSSTGGSGDTPNGSFSFGDAGGAGGAAQLAGLNLTAGGQLSMGSLQVNVSSANGQSGTNAAGGHGGAGGGGGSVTLGNVVLHGNTFVDSPTAVTQINGTNANSSGGLYLGDLQLQADSDMSLANNLGIFLHTTQGVGTVGSLKIAANGNITSTSNLNILNSFVPITMTAGNNLTLAGQVTGGALDLIADHDFPTATHLGTGTINLTNATLNPQILRVFGVSPNMVALGSWTPSTTNTGLYYGDAGTSATGVYYKTNQIPLSITANNKTITYGALTLPAFTASFNGLTNGDSSTVVTGLKFNTTATLGSNVGTYAITPFGASAPLYYTIQYTNGLLTIDPATLNVVANNNSRTYGSANPILTATVNGLVNGDTQTSVVSFTPSTAATSASNVGNYQITPNAVLSGSKSGNYILTQTNGTLTINPAPLTVTANNASKVYGNVNPALTDNVSGLVNGDTQTNVVSFTPSTAATSASNVGTYQITPNAALNGSQSGNYTLTQTNGTLTINPAQLTVTANNASKVYGNINPALTDNVSGLVNGDTQASVVSLAPSTTATSASNVGAYQIAPNAVLLSGNYVLTSQTNGTLTITKAPLTVAANNAGRTFNTPNPTFSVNAIGLVNGDTQANVFTANPSTTATIGSNVGTYQINPNAALPSSLSLSGNYVLTQVNGVLTIATAAVTVSANNQSKVYGAALPTLTVTVTGIPSGMTQSSVVTAAPTVNAIVGSNVGFYTIKPNAQLVNNNYTLVQNNGTLTITKAPLTVTANNASKVYGSANPALTDSVSGLVNGNTQASVVSLAPSTTATTGSNVGTYQITPNATLLSNNYTLTQNNGAFQITAAPLTVTANNASKVYGSANPTLIGSVSGLVNGDTQANVVTVNPTTNATIGSNVGTYQIAPNAVLLSGNYVLSTNNGTLTVTKASLTVTANNVSKVYGSVNPTLTDNVSGLVNHDVQANVVSLAPNTTATNGSNVGTYQITPNATLLSNNYTLTQNNGTFQITAAPLTVAANDVSKVYGSANPTLTDSVNGLVNGDTQANVVSFNNSTTANVGSNVGSYQIAPNAVLLSGNYVLTSQTNGTLTITKAPLTVTADNVSKVYGSVNPTLTDSVSGLVNGNTQASVVSLAPSTTATNGSNAGAYQIAPNATLLSNNYTLTQNNGSLTISPAPLTVTANNTSKVYGSANPALTGSVSGLVNGDTQASVVQFKPTTTATTGSNVGAYQVAPNAVLLSGNYVLATNNGTLTITPASLTVSADNASKVYGTANPILSDRVHGLVNGDTRASVLQLNPTTTATTLSNVGSYQISPNAVLLSGNYVISNQINGTLTVQKAALTVTPESGSVTRGDTPIMTMNCPTPQSCSLAGASTQVNSQNNVKRVVSSQGDTVTYTGDFKSQYNTPDHLVWKVSGLVGNDASSLSGAPSFAWSNSNGTLQLGQGTLKASPNYVFKVQDPSSANWLKVLNPQLTVSIADLYSFPNLDLTPHYVFTGLRGDNAQYNGSNLNGGSITWTTPAKSGADSGLYPITPTGPSTFNFNNDPNGPYDVNYQSGALTVVRWDGTINQLNDSVDPNTKAGAILSGSLGTSILTTDHNQAHQQKLQTYSPTYSQVPTIFGLPSVFTSQLTTIVQMFLQANGNPGTVTGADNWIFNNANNPDAYGQLLPYILQWMEYYETNQSALAWQKLEETYVKNPFAGQAPKVTPPSDSDTALYNFIKQDLQNKRISAENKVVDTYLAWKSHPYDNNADPSYNSIRSVGLVTLLSSQPNPPDTLMAIAQSGGNPSGASNSDTLAHVLGAASAGAGAAILGTATAANIASISVGIATNVARGLITAGELASVEASAFAGPAAIVAIALEIAVEGGMQAVKTDNFEKDLYKAVDHADSNLQIRDLMSDKKMSIGTVMNLASLLSNGTSSNALTTHSTQLVQGADGRYSIAPPPPTPTTNTVTTPTTTQFKPTTTEFRPANSTPSTPSINNTPSTPNGTPTTINVPPSNTVIPINTVAPIVSDPSLTINSTSQTQ